MDKTQVPVSSTDRDLMSQKVRQAFSYGQKYEIARALGDDAVSLEQWVCAMGHEFNLEDEPVKKCLRFLVWLARLHGALEFANGAQSVRCVEQLDENHRSLVDQLRETKDLVSATIQQLVVLQADVGSGAKPPASFRTTFDCAHEQFLQAAARLREQADHYRESIDLMSKQREFDS